MIPAQKDGAWSAVVRAYIAWKVRTAFRALWVSGPVPPVDEPLIAYANHTSFWDGFVAQRLCELWSRDGYCVVEEPNLLKYPFLARAGAFSIRRGDPRSTVETFRYITELLGRPRAMVFTFAEGKLRPFTDAPQLERGLEVVARKTGVRCVPVAIRPVFFEDEKPELMVAVGEAHPPEPIAQSQQRLGALCRRILESPAREGFELALAGARGARARWDAVRGRAH